MCLNMSNITCDHKPPIIAFDIITWKLTAQLFKLTYIRFSHI